MKNPYQKLVHQLDWKGLEASYLEKYKTWVNKSHPGICGTFVSAVLFDDYLVRNRGLHLDKDHVLAGFESVVDDLMPYKGTFVWDLYYGLTYMGKALEDPPRVRIGLFPDQTILDIMEGPRKRPVIIGTTSLLNSPYKNHWLIATAYAFDGEGKLYFKAYDNHGRIDAVVPASQTLAYAYLD